jgi:hypothetical protein
MITRILGEGQLDLPREHLAELDTLDDALLATMDAGEEAAFHQALDALLTAARRFGRPLPDDLLAPSELVLPAAGSSLTQVQALLGGDGLIPG